MYTCKQACYKCTVHKHILTVWLYVVCVQCAKTFSCIGIWIWTKPLWAFDYVSSHCFHPALGLNIQHPSSHNHNGLTTWSDPLHFSFQSFTLCPGQPESQLAAHRPSDGSVCSWCENYPHLHPTHTSTTTGLIREAANLAENYYNSRCTFTTERIPSLLIWHHCAAKHHSCLPKYLHITLTCVLEVSVTFTKPESTEILIKKN